jgi:pilus assembly protein CpaB
MAYLLGADDLRELEVPVEVIPRNAVKSLEQAVGRFAKAPLIAGEMVLEHHLADPTNSSGDLAFVIGDDQVLMAFSPGDLLTSLNILQPGDLVDILVTMSHVVPVTAAEQEGGVAPTPVPAGEEPPTETRIFTFDAMQRLKLTAIIYDVVVEEGTRQTSASAPVDVTGAVATPQPTPTPPPASSRIKTFLLALSPQDALVLKHLKDTGAKFDLVLRAPTSTELFDLTPVIPDYLVDRFELEIKK